jgi:hypothetical protein
MKAFSSDCYPLVARLFIALFAFFCVANSVGAESTDPGGGIGGTGITGFGVVQKFGSIFVNGREYILDSNTRVIRDGVSTDEKTLHLGDVVNVQGRIDANSGRSVALRVDSETTLQGAVDQVDASSGTLTVLGQVVRVSPTTLSDGLKPASWLAGIRPGERITVSGLPRSDNSWTATRLARLPANESRFVLHGIVVRAEPERGRLRVSGLDLIVPSGRFPSHLAYGDIVRVEGHYVDAVRQVENVGIAQPKLGLAGQMVEMSGYIQGQPGSGRLVSNHVVLSYSDTTAFIASTAADVRKDVPVIVRGEIQADGGVAVHEIRVNVEPMRATLPEIEIRPSHEGRGERQGVHGAPEKPEREKPDVEKAGAERHEAHRPEKPEVERPEIARPQIERPEIERPSIELPKIEKPEIEH